jgi:hypothetical protein
MRLSLLLKRIPLVFICLFFCFFVCAQNTPVNNGKPAASPVPVPAAYVSPTINYVRTWVPVKPITDPQAVITNNNIREVQQSTQYFDGLGRPLQTVAKGMSAAGNDIVAPVVYDEFGREQFKYLPYVPKTGNTNDGKFKTPKSRYKG